MFGKAEGMPQNFGPSILKKRNGILCVEFVAISQQCAGKTRGRYITLICS
jgi:hypothetical protein